MKKNRKLKLHKKIISFVLVLAVFMSSIYVPMDWKISIPAIFPFGARDVVYAAEETCPYSEDELSATTFDQSSVIDIDTMEKLCKFSWWYKNYADNTSTTTVNIGLTSTSIGGSAVVFVDDKFTSIGDAAKPFYGTIKISGTSNNLFFCRYTNIYIYY